MKNYVQRGDAVDVTAPFAVTSGSALQIGVLFGICGADAASGASVALHTRGVFDVTKVSAQAWTVGQAIYWDDSAKAFTNVAVSGGIKVGIAVAAAANPSATGRVLIFPGF